MNVTVQQALKKIAASNDGVLTAEAVVEAAESEASPLHSLFVWDNSEAARLWRLHQARNIILRIKMEVPTEKDETVTVRSWVSLTPDRDEDGGGYREVMRVMRNADQRAQMLNDALAEMERFREKYQALKELSAVFTAMKKVSTARRGA